MDRNRWIDEFETEHGRKPTVEELEKFDQEKGGFLCPKCGAHVNDDVALCPSCGYRLKKIDKEDVQSAKDSDKKEDEIEMKAQEMANKILCPNCGHEISKDDEKCPNCGFDLRKGEVQDMSSGMFWGLAFIAVVLLIIAIVFINNFKG